MSDEGSDKASWVLPAEFRSPYDELAKLVGCDRTVLVHRALEQYLAREGADVLAAANGDAEFDRGESSDFDDVLSDLEAIVRGRAA